MPLATRSRFPAAFPRFLALLLCAALALSQDAFAQDTLLVTNTNNDGPGSLRAAVAEANATPGPQTIAFNVPLSDPGYIESLGVFYIVLESTSLALTDDGTTIDGATQTAFTGDTNPNGPELGVRAYILDSHISVFDLQSDGNVIREIIGFHYARYGVSISGSDNRVEGCVIIQPLQAGVHVTGTNNTIGGMALELGNRIASSGVGVQLSTAGATGNDVLNNRIHNNNSGGMTVEGSDNRIGAPGAGNVFVQNGHTTHEQFTSGHHLSVSGSGNVVQGNFIGVEADGVTNAAFPASVGLLATGPNTLVGGRAEGEGNVFGGFSFYIHIADRRRALSLSGAGSVAEGNRIGLGLDDATPLPSREGAVLSADVRFGGTEAGAGNLVAHAEEVGVAVNPGATGAAILGNRIFANDGLGIDLGADGPTPNDPQDTDEGANRRQNHPALSAALSGTTLTVTYAVDTAPSNAAYPLRVEFFRADEDGEEGALFLAADSYTEADYDAGTPGAKAAVLDVSGSGLAVGDLVVATATDAAGNTSEFAAAVGLTEGTPTAAGAPPAGGESALSAPYPNPSHSSTRFSLEVAEAQEVRVEVLDALGRLVARLHDGWLAAGTHELALDGRALPSGVYVIRAAGEDVDLTRRVSIVR